MTKGKRLVKSALTIKKDMYYYQGKLFTGVVFDVKDNQVVEAFMVKDGKKKGAYSSKYYQPNADALHITDDHPDIKGEMSVIRLMYREKPFNGVYYVIDGDYCTQEGLIIEGWPRFDVTWYENGQLGEYGFWDKDTAATYHFRPDGSFGGAYIRKTTDVEMTVGFDEDNRLTTLKLTPRFLEMKNNKIDRLPFSTVMSFDEITALRAANEVTLSEAGVTAELVQTLLDNTAFSDTTSIRLWWTGVTDKQIEAFASLSKLKKIYATDKHGDLSTAMIALKKKRPDVKVHYKFRIR